MATQNEVGAHLDLTRQAVADLIARGVLPKGELNLDECRLAYIRHLREQAAGRANSELAAWRTEVAKEQAEKLARENAIKRGELIPAADVGIGLADLIGHCRARLLAIPTKGAPIIAMLGGKTAEIRAALTELVHEALDELSRTAVVPGAARTVDGAGDGAGGDAGDAGVVAAAEADGEPVG